MNYFEKYVGTEIGKLKILSISSEKLHKKTYFICKCECGTTRRVNASKLIRGVVKGCQKCKNKGINNAKWAGYEEISGTHLYDIKSSCRRRSGNKAVYNISNEYIWKLFLKQDRKCALSGLFIEFAKSTYIRGTASLDRIDSSKGYIEGNVQWVHKDVNRIKSDISEDYFVELCKLITKNMETINRKIKSKNVINVLYPYRTENGTWVYDDSDIGVFKEAFVMGSSEVIDHLVGLDCNNFKLLISSNPIPNYTAKLNKLDREYEGWYQLEGTNMEHWLCGCVLDYFENYPDNIYVKIEI